jgi:hypothetical protein
MKLEINVPTSLNEISLKSYQKFLKTQEEAMTKNLLHKK